jgi:hypothetical protein
MFVRGLESPLKDQIVPALPGRLYLAAEAKAGLNALIGNGCAVHKRLPWKLDKSIR